MELAKQAEKQVYARVVFLGAAVGTNLLLADTNGNIKTTNQKEKENGTTRS